MTARCEAELCPNWSGDGDVCPCAVFDLPRPAAVDEWLEESGGDLS